MCRKKSSSHWIWTHSYSWFEWKTRRFENTIKLPQQHGRKAKLVGIVCFCLGGGITLKRIPQLQEIILLIKAIFVFNLREYAAKNILILLNGKFYKDLTGMHRWMYIALMKAWRCSDVIQSGFQKFKWCGSWWTAACINFIEGYPCFW